MKKVLLGLTLLVLVLSLLLIPMAMLPGVGANAPPLGETALLAVPATDAGTVVAAPAILKSYTNSAGADLSEPFALGVIALVAMSMVAVRKKPIILRLKALFRRCYYSSRSHGAIGYSILNCPI